MNGMRCSTRLHVPGATGLLCALLPVLAQAHGAKIEYQMVPAISLYAKYDSGEPMTAAQIAVYAPNDPAKPWLTGKGNKDGYFSFVPDSAIAGEWMMQAREAGHGAMAHFTVGGNAVAATVGASGSATSAAAAPPAALETTAQTPLQRWLMAASVIWGFIGTGLFFSRRKAG